jgi:hypothetical protein
VTATRDTIAAWAGRTLTTGDERRRFCRALAESFAVDVGLPLDVVGIEVEWHPDRTTIRATVTALPPASEPTPP